MLSLLLAIAFAGPPVADRVYSYGNLNIGTSLQARKYDGMELPQTATEAGRLAMKKLKENERTVWVESADGTRQQVWPRVPGSPKLHQLADGAAWGALIASTALRVPEREMDLIVRDDDDALRTLTVRFETDGTVLRSGQKVPLLEGGVTVQQLEERYGIELVEENGAFPLVVLRALRDALGMLSPEEAAQLRGLQVATVEDPKAVPLIPQQQVWLNYASIGLQGRLEVVGSSPGRVSWFVGPVDAPVDAMVYETLHHLGRALVDRRRRDEVDVLMERRARFEAEKASLEARYETLSAKGGSNAERRALNADVEAHENRGHELNALTQELTVAKQGGALFYTEAFGGARKAAVTRNSRDDDTFAFADAFALFHADPEALEWIDKRAWFEAGEHLESDSAAD